MAYPISQKAVPDWLAATGMTPITNTAPGTSTPASTGLLSMPDFTYDKSKLALNADGQLQAKDFLSGYYGQMTENYLPTMDTFASENAGKMVAFDPNKLMSIEDFGLGTSRGDLRNIDLSQKSHNTAFGNDDTGNVSVPYYTRTPDGQYRAATGREGEELFTHSRSEPTWQNPDGEDVWTPAGKYHKETAQEAADRLLGQGGGYKTEGQGAQRSDFMGETTLTDLTTKANDKWGQDFVNMPELKPYLDDPAWVTKTDGKVTAIRAELLPLMLRESIGEEYRDMTRGTTKDAEGFGGLVKMVVIGTVTAGFGAAAAAGMGMTTATGALTAAGQVTAGAIGGGMSAGLQGGNILQGAALGGLGGAASPYISKPLTDAGLTNKTLNAGATKAITGGLSAAIQGKDVAMGAVAGGITGMITSMLPDTGSKSVNGAINGVIGNVVGGYVSQMMNPAGASTDTAATVADTTTTTTDDEDATDTPAASNNRYYAARQSRVVI